MSVPAPSDSISKLVRAAAKAGVPYILPNCFGHEAANYTLFNDSLVSHNHDSICAEIESLGISLYLLLACSFWYEVNLGGGPDCYSFNFRKCSFVLFDDGNVAVNTSTWPQCGRAFANPLSLRELSNDETDGSPTLSEFRNSYLHVELPT